MSLIDNSNIKQTISNLLHKFTNDKEMEVIKRNSIIENDVFSVIENQDVLGEYYSDERNQYFYIFKNRFKNIRSRLITVTNKLGTDKMIDDIASLNEFKNQQVSFFNILKYRAKITVAGIIIKDIAKRPNILKDIDTFIVNKNVEKFNGDKDICYLEGETGRIKLKFLETCDIKENFLCTGLICNIV